MTTRAKVSALLACALLLAGCASTPGRGSRLLPWNWFSPDHAAQLSTAQTQTAAAQHSLTRQAQAENAKTVQALAAAPQDSRAVQVASRTAQNADDLLTRANGPITAGDLAALRQTVAQLLSENTALRASGEAAQANAERTSAQLSRALDDARARETALTAKLQSSDRRYQAEAETARKWRFWILAILGGWLILQLLSGISRFFPSLAPVAKLAGTVIAPAVQAGYHRVTAAVGKAIADAGQAGGDLAEAMRQHLDANTDAADQTAIRNQYQRLT